MGPPAPAPSTPGVQSKKDKARAAYMSTPLDVNQLDKMVRQVIQNAVQDNLKNQPFVLPAKQDPAKVLPSLLRQAFAAHATSLPPLFSGQATTAAKDLRAVTAPIAQNINKLVDAMQEKVGKRTPLSASTPNPTPLPASAYAPASYSGNDVAVLALVEKQRQARKRTIDAHDKEDAIQREVKRRLQLQAQDEEDARELSALKLLHAEERIRQLENEASRR